MKTKKRSVPQSKFKLKFKRLPKVLFATTVPDENGKSVMVVDVNRHFHDHCLKSKFLHAGLIIGEIFTREFVQGTSPMKMSVLSGATHLYFTMSNNHHGLEMIRTGSKALINPFSGDRFEDSCGMGLEETDEHLTLLVPFLLNGKILPALVRYVFDPSKQDSHNAHLDENVADEILRLIGEIK